MKPDWFQEIAARMAAEMRELDHEFASLKDYEAGIASRPGGTTMKPDPKALLSAAEWCDAESHKITDSLVSGSYATHERQRLDQHRFALWMASTLMRGAAMEMEE